MSRVLIVEDTSELLEWIGIVLRNSGYTVFEARNGERGLALARRERPDLIVLDIEMPGMDGVEVLRHVREDAQLASRPIVALTAAAMTGDRERLLAAGFTGYISKPIRARRLVQEIGSFLAAEHLPGLPDACLERETRGNSQS